MLAVPEEEIRKSTTEHNSKLEVVADWIELSALSAEGRISFATVVDALKDSGIYERDHFAWEFVDLVIAEFNRRQISIGTGYPFAIDSRGITCTGSVSDNADYAFCVISSVGPAYEKFRRSANAGDGISVRGRLFEELAAECMAAVLPSWDVKLTGWHSSAAAGLPSLVHTVSGMLGVPTNARGIAVNAKRKDAGLDVLCLHQALDNRGHRASVFLACATGVTDWKGKRKEPDLEVWNAVLDIWSKPMPGFAVPFALSGQEFDETVCLNKGMVLDRLRLLARRDSSRAWLSSSTSTKLEQWVQKHLPAVPEI